METSTSLGTPVYFPIRFLRRQSESQTENLGVAERHLRPNCGSKHRVPVVGNVAPVIAAVSGVPLTRKQPRNAPPTENGASCGNRATIRPEPREESHPSTGKLSEPADRPAGRRSSDLVERSRFAASEVDRFLRPAWCFQHENQLTRTPGLHRLRSS